MTSCPKGWTSSTTGTIASTCPSAWAYRVSGGVGATCAAAATGRNTSTSTKSIAFEVLVGQDYLGRLNAPTEWTKRAVRHFRDVTRGLCRVAGSQGIGQGGVAATLRICAAPDRGDQLRRHLVREAIPALLDRTGIVGAHLGFTDDAGSRLETAEKKARGSLTDIPPWVLVVEGISAERVAAAVSATLPEPVLAANGAAGPATTGIYRLESARLKTGWSAG